MKGSRERAALPTTTLAGGQVLALRRAEGAAALGREEREQLIADARAGKLVSVHLDALTYLQRATPNRNLVRFRDGLLKRLARSFRGTPFLRDHRQDDSLARAGTVLTSELVDGPGDGVKSFRQVLEVVEPWAVEAALRGTIDRFSIGWHATGETVCSVCGEPMTQSWFWVDPTCEHELGAEYEGEVCQLEYTEAEGIEVSAVTVPAVVGTEIQDIRASLAAARGGPERPKEPNMKRIVKLLGLADDATEDQVLAELEKRQIAYDAAEEARRRLEADLGAAAQRLAAAEATERSRRVEALRDRGRAEGRFIPGGETETKILQLAGQQLELAESIVKDLPRVTPVGQPPQSAGADPKSRAGALSAAQKIVNRQLGITPEAFAKYAPKAGALSAVKDEE